MFFFNGTLYSRTETTHIFVKLYEDYAKWEQIFLTKLHPVKNLYRKNNELNPTYENIWHSWQVRGKFALLDCYLWTRATAFHAACPQASSLARWLHLTSQVTWRHWFRPIAGWLYLMVNGLGLAGTVSNRGNPAVPNNLNFINSLPVFLLCYYMT